MNVLDCLFLLQPVRIATVTTGELYTVTQSIPPRLQIKHVRH